MEEEKDKDMWVRFSKDGKCYFSSAAFSASGLAVGDRIKLVRIGSNIAINRSPEHELGYFRINENKGTGQVYFSCTRLMDHLMIEEGRYNVHYSGIMTVVMDAIGEEDD